MSAGLDERTVRAEVMAVWREELPLLPFDEALTWRDAGVDSLKSLQILLKLEKALGRAISFDLFTLDSQLGEVIGVLSGRTAAPNATTPNDVRRQVFVLPGIKGDGRDMAGFRRALVSQIRFETLDYPGMDVPAKVHADLRHQTDLIVQEVVRRQPDGPIIISGYSFGGFMAFEAARVLIAAGREVGLVILFDTFVGSVKPGRSDAPEAEPKRYPIVPRVARQPGEGLRAYLERLTFQVLVKSRRLEAARRLANWCSGHTDIEQNDIRRRRMLELMRGSAMRQWRPKPISTPVLLITSDDYHAWSDVEVWPELCPDLTVRHVGGSHVGLFGSEALPDIRGAVLAALARLDPEPSDLVAA